MTVDIALGTAHGTAAGDIAQVGTDTFSGVNAVMGSTFADTLMGSNGNEQFQGLAGNDYIDGRGGFDTAQYNNLTYVTGGITVDMASGVVTGDASTGTDTLRSIEGVQGTFFDDIYVATGYGNAGALNIGNNGTFNQFEGMGGNDTVTGNGNTRLIYGSATAGVTVSLTGAGSGTVDGDLSVGHDTFTGVGSVQGSNFADTMNGGLANDNLLGGGGADTINGGAGNDLITGQAGDDIIDGGAGTDVAVFSGPRSAYTINFASGTVTDNRTATPSFTPDGTDTLTNVEVLQFSDQLLLAASGSAANPIDVSSFFFPSGPLTGTSGDDYLTIGFSMFNRAIDLGAGDNTVTIAVGGGTLNLTNVQHLVGTGGDDFINLLNNANGLTVDLGAGTNDGLNLANGSNSISVVGVENINGSDFDVISSDDTLTFLNNVDVSFLNLGNGTNTVNLAGGSNSFTGIFNVQHINGSAGDDTLTISDGLFENGNNPIVDLGAGDNTLNLGTMGASLTALNVQHLNGSSLDNFITLNNNVSGIAVDLGDGNDSLGLADGVNSISVFNVESINGSDWTTPSDDTLNLLNNVSGVNVNLAGGNNTLNLAAGSNSFGDLWGVNLVNGSSLDDTLTIQGNAASTIDLGAGTDTLILANGFGGVTVANIENVIGGSNNDNINIADITGTVTVTGGLGSDFISLGGSSDNVRFTSTAESAVGGGDTVNNFDVVNDAFLFDHIGGLAGPIHFVSDGILDGTGPEARLNGNLLQIDINGDGLIDAGDMEIYVNGLNGSLTDANFVVTGVDHAPTDILLSADTVAENSTNGTVVGSLSAIDPDAGDSATLSLVDDAGGLFAIDGNNLVVAGALDYETAVSHQVTVRVTDSGGLTYDKAFLIALTDVNEAPAVTSGASASVAENAATSTVVYQATATDPDGTAPNNTITWSLSGADAAAFSIDASGNVTLNSSADFETKNSYSIDVVATDGGSSVQLQGGHCKRDRRQRGANGDFRRNRYRG